MISQIEMPGPRSERSYNPKEVSWVYRVLLVVRFRFLVIHRNFLNLGRAFSRINRNGSSNVVETQLAFPLYEQVST